MLCHVSVLIGAFCLRHRARDKSFLFRLRFRIFYYYFGFATLRNVSKLTFFDKIGRAKSVGFWFYSAIWRSESRISSRYLEITSISLIYSLTYSRKKEFVFWLSWGWPASKLSYLGKRREPLENAHSRETRFTRPNRRACSQAIPGFGSTHLCDPSDQRRL